MFSKSSSKKSITVFWSHLTIKKTTSRLIILIHSKALNKNKLILRSKIYCKKNKIKTDLCSKNNSKSKSTSVPLLINLINKNQTTEKSISNSQNSNNKFNKKHFKFFISKICLKLSKEALKIFLLNKSLQPKIKTLTIFLLSLTLT